MRVTHHPMADRLVDWHPDGTRVLFVSGRESGRQRYNQFYLAPATGGLPDEAAGAVRRVRQLLARRQEIAYLPQTQAFRTWKRYRGGWSPDIWLFDLTTLAASNVTKDDAERRVPDVARRHDLLPVGSRRRTSGRTSGRSTRGTGAVRQVTDFPTTT